jgi:bifunctional non-homologous end joining protein LigD
VPSLATYRKKRDFSQTREPSGAAAPKKGGAELGYVIQKHAARRLHYDFRLELDGVLLSWAVPKGPSLDPAVKRLAQETEPHPLDYASFEGTIPKGQYGGGTVMVWDRGSWSPIGDARAGYAKGHLEFTLDGDKLAGRWHLVRTRSRGNGKEDKSWLLFKAHDESASSERDIVEEKPDSVVTGRDLDQIATGARPKRAAARAKPITRGKSTPRGAKSSPKARSALPKQLEPELATLVDSAPTGDDWLHEIKLDGYRILARIQDGQASLFTRNGKDWTERMPALARALEKLDFDSAWIDGELVALDEKGVSDFQTLQNSLDEDREAGLVYYAFDLPFDDGEDLRTLPLLERKERLARHLGKKAKAGTVRLSEHVLGSGPEFFEQAGKLGLEGIISKRAAAPYRAGRGRDWLKVKCQLRQEFVIVGFSAPKGSRTHLGALLLGVEREGKLSYAGRVGTGVTETSLDELSQKLARLARKTAPVEDAPRGAEVRDVIWAEPKLLCEISFTGFTKDGRLRHPVFHGLREDKPARGVKLEKPQEAAYPLSNPDKVLYPELSITKRELLEYYELVAERMLPHVAGRPLTLVRCPEGRTKQCFFQKHPGRGTPEGLRAVPIREKDGKAPYTVIDDEQGLFGLVQLGALEIHTWGAHEGDPERPDLLVLDLDPDPELDFKEVVRCAERLREVFESAKLESFVKSTGGKGLHVCVPFEPELSWSELKSFTKHIAEAFAARYPKEYLATVSKAKRTGKIFIDYLRNARGATFIAPYSTRARENAPVAVPLEWDEIAKFKPGDFTLRNLSKRLKKQRVDPFQRMAELKQKLPRESLE